MGSFDGTTQLTERSERCLDIMRPLWMPDQGNEDPAVAHYMDDKPIQELDIDINARIFARRRGWLGSINCWCPLSSLGYNILGCATPMMYMWMPSQEKIAAQAHRLTLRERTLLLEVDEHSAKSLSQAPIMCDMCCGRQTVNGYTQVVRLATVHAAMVEEPHPAGFGDCTPNYAQHFVVVTEGSKVMLAIEAPVDGEAFAQRVMEQKQKVLAKGLDSNPMDPRLPAHIEKDLLSAKMRNLESLMKDVQARTSTSGKPEQQLMRMPSGSGMSKAGSVKSSSTKVASEPSFSARSKSDDSTDKPLTVKL